MDGVRYDSTGAAGTLPGASGDARASNCPCDDTVKTRGELPYPSPFDEGDCFAHELPSLVGLYDDYEGMDFGCGLTNPPSSTS